MQTNSTDDLLDLLAAHNITPTTKKITSDTGDENGSILSFDWRGPSGTNYGTVVVTMIDNDLSIFFTDSLGRTMEKKQDRRAWLGTASDPGFLGTMKNFATRHNIGTFSVKDINQLKHSMRGMTAMNESLLEGLDHGRRRTYVEGQNRARLVIQHHRSLSEHEHPGRAIESLWIITAEGERCRLPFTKLAGGRAMLEHVNQGGHPYDIRAAHIKQIVHEINLLTRFSRASARRVFEDHTQNLVDHAKQYLKELKTNLQKLSNHRGYHRYFEQWSPSQLTEQDEVVDSIRNMFVEQQIDSRIEAVMPILARLPQEPEMKQTAMFEQWVNQVCEGTWALPDTPDSYQKLQQLMSAPLIVGPDAVNATEQLYDLVGDDQLFDILSNLAERSSGRANVWSDSDVQARLQELGIDLQQAATAADNVAAPAADQQPMQESVMLDESNQTLEHILNRYKHEVKQFMQTMDLDSDLFDALYDYYWDRGDMPYGVAKARTGDPYAWVSDRLAQDLEDLDITEGWKDKLAGAALAGTLALGTGALDSNSRTGPDPFAPDINTGVKGSGAVIMNPTDRSRTDIPYRSPLGTGTVIGEGGCNMTAEGEYCPEHGLVECGTYESQDDPINANSAITSSFYESQLDQLKRLAFGK